ncbi:MAG: LON peptidase substrate-binding domain-containing protein, partial [Myxococcales bacterium]|nr:LON peptidase substrate-binding domain-containing protein [Myxococcales bacterium]
MLDSHEHLHVPVFPLPRVVFFPGTTLPLHFFEPRYRAMMDHVAEAGVTHMAVVLLAPGWEAEYEGRPAIHRVAGLGRIVEHERLPNGTHNAILRGVARVALEEHPSVEMPFRMATARPVEGHGVPSAEALAGLVSASQAVAVEVRKQHPAFELD